ncbi:MAG TPA: hypothetical protein PLG38_12455, partial [Propionibacteriaceae bacterium]|nr:hypothetical protein [Propionibacteriaceae bacterium]
MGLPYALLCLAVGGIGAGTALAILPGRLVGNPLDRHRLTLVPPDNDGHAMHALQVRERARGAFGV